MLYTYSWAMVQKKVTARSVIASEVPSDGALRDSWIVQIAT
ncbi:MAG TPA: hypothetical protein VHV10_04160 [Ktedonobacteraceae bacterium]|nr:hypothetical protein [Ktedonobacteraceae bacterium]